MTNVRPPKPNYALHFEFLVALDYTVRSTVRPCVEHILSLLAGYFSPRFAIRLLIAGRLLCVCPIPNTQVRFF